MGELAFSLGDAVLQHPCKDAVENVHAVTVVHVDGRLFGLNNNSTTTLGRIGIVCKDEALQMRGYITRLLLQMLCTATQSAEWSLPEEAHENDGAAPAGRNNGRRGKKKNKPRKKQRRAPDTASESSLLTAPDEAAASDGADNATNSLSRQGFYMNDGTPRIDVFFETVVDDDGNHVATRVWFVEHTPKEGERALEMDRRVAMPDAYTPTMTGEAKRTIKQQAEHCKRLRKEGVLASTAHVSYDRITFASYCAVYREDDTLSTQFSKHATGMARVLGIAAKTHPCNPYRVFNPWDAIEMARGACRIQTTARAYGLAAIKPEAFEGLGATLRWPSPDHVHQVMVEAITPYLVMAARLPSRANNIHTSLLARMESILERQASNMDALTHAEYVAALDDYAAALRADIGETARLSSIGRARMLSERNGPRSDGAHRELAEGRAQRAGIDEQLRAIDTMRELRENFAYERDMLRRVLSSKQFPRFMHLVWTPAAFSIWQEHFNLQRALSKGMTAIVKYGLPLLETYGAAMPALPCDPTMRTWGNYVVRRLQQYESVLGVVANHKQFFLLRTATHDAHRVAPDADALRNNVFFTGAPGLGKTYMMELMCQLNVRETIQMIAHASQQGFLGDGENNLDLARFFEEVNDALINGHANGGAGGSGGQSTGNTNTKAMMTNQVMQTMRMTRDNGTGAQTVKHAVSLQGSMFAFASNNGFESSVPGAIASRVRASRVCSSKRKGVSAVDRARDTMTEEQRAVYDQIVLEHQIEHTLVALVEVLIGLTPLLPQVNMEVADRIFTCCLDTLKEHGVHVNKNVRAYQRMRFAARTETIKWAIHMVFNGMAAPCGADAVDEHGRLPRFSLDQLLRVKPYLVCPEDIALSMFTAYADEYLDDVGTTLLRQIAREFGKWRGWATDEENAKTRYKHVIFETTGEGAVCHNRIRINRKLSELASNAAFIAHLDTSTSDKGTAGVENNEGLLLRMTQTWLKVGRRVDKFGNVHPTETINLPIIEDHSFDVNGPHVYLLIDALDRDAEKLVELAVCKCFSATSQPTKIINFFTSADPVAPHLPGVIYYGGSEGSVHERRARAPASVRYTRGYACTTPELSVLGASMHTRTHFTDQRDRPLLRDDVATQYTAQVTGPRHTELTENLDLHFSLAHIRACGLDEHDPDVQAAIPHNAEALERDAAQEYRRRHRDAPPCIHYPNDLVDAFHAAEKARAQEEERRATASVAPAEDVVRAADDAARAFSTDIRTVRIARRRPQRHVYGAFAPPDADAAERLLESLDQEAHVSLDGGGGDSSGDEGSASGPVVGQRRRRQRSPRDEPYPKRMRPSLLLGEDSRAFDEAADMGY